MKSNIKKRVLAVVLCMVLMLSTGISTMADGEVAAGTPAPESGASQEPAAASVEGEAVEGETVEGEQTPAEQSTETQEETPTEPSAAESKDEPAADINSVSGVTELVGSNGIQNEASEQETETDLTEQEPEVEIVSEATELKQEFTDEAGNVTQRVIANIPEGAFQANASEITMEVNYLDEAAENHVKELMTAALPENEILGDYILYDIKFKVNGEVTEPQKAIAITFEGSGLHIEDTKKANVFYLDPADPEVQDDKDEIVEITQKSEMIENLQNAGQSIENIDEYDLSEISVKEDGTADQILMEGRISTVYGCYVEKTPVQVLEYSDDDVTINVNAYTEDAIPAGASLKVVPLRSDNEETEEKYKEVEEQLNKKAENEEYDIAGFLAYDISFINEIGEEVEPNGDVKVTINYNQEAIPEGMEEDSNLDVTVMHLEENNTGDVKAVVDMAVDTSNVVTVETTDDAKVKKAEFVTDSFSAYTITWKRSYYKAKVTAHYGYMDGSAFREFPDSFITGISSAFDDISSTTVVDLRDERHLGNVEGYSFKEIRLDNANDGTLANYLKRGDNTYQLYFSKDNKGYTFWTNLEYSGNEKDIYYIFTENSDDAGDIAEPVPSVAKRANQVDEKNNNYNLELDVSSSIGSITDKAKLDVLLIIDRSGSMDNDDKMSDAKVAAEKLLSTLHDNNSLNLQYSLVSFSGKSNDGRESNASIDQPWTQSVSDMYTAIRALKANDGTNYQAAFRKAKSLLTDSKVRKSASQVVIFLTDGLPTSYIGDSSSTGTATNYYDVENARSELQTLSGVEYFYGIGFGSAFEELSGTGYNVLKALTEGGTVKIGKSDISCSGAPASIERKMFSAGKLEDLNDVFSSIASTVTKIACKNVTVTDTLSQYVESSDTTTYRLRITRKADKTVVVETNEELWSQSTTTPVITGTAGYNKTQDESKENNHIPLNLAGLTGTKLATNGKTITCILPSDYELSPDYTYTLIINDVDVSEQAFKDYKDNNGYNAVGQTDTGTFSRQEGFFSNDNDKAKMTYTVNDVPKEVMFPHPVVQIVGNASLVFEKVDQDGNPLAGATFALYNKPEQEGEELGEPIKSEIISGADGKIVIEDLEDGTYILKETAPPDGYLVTTDTWTVQVKKGVAILLNKSGDEITKITNWSYSQGLNKDKKVQLNNWDERTYDITLSASSLITSVTEESQQPIDVVMVLDTSGSMRWDCEYDQLYASQKIKDLDAGTYYLHENGIWYQIWKSGQYWKIKYHNYSGNAGTIRNNQDAADTYSYGITTEKRYTIYKEIASPTTRIDALKTAASGFIDQLAAKSPGSQVAIVPFASGVGTVTDLSNVGLNQSELTAAINELVADGATQTSDAVEEAYNIIKKAQNPTLATSSNPKYVIVLTDGAANEGYKDDAVVYADKLKNTQDGNAGVFTIGFGLDSETSEWLSQLASKAGWNYTANNANELINAFDFIIDATTTGITIPNAVIRDYIDPRFEVVESSLPDGATLGVDDNGNQYVEWKTSILPSSEDSDGNSVPGWRATFTVKAKDDYIGGNAVKTNMEGSGIIIGDKTIPFINPTVNVKATLDTSPYEVTIYKGDTIPVYTTQTGDETIQSKMASIDKWFVNEYEGVSADKFTFKWYSDKECTQEVNISELASPENSVVYYLKVTYNAGDHTEESDANTIEPGDTVSHHAGEITTGDAIDDNIVEATDTYTVNVISGKLQLIKKLEQDATNDQIFSFIVEKKNDDETYTEMATVEINVPEGTEAGMEVSPSENELKKLEGLSRGEYRIRESDTDGYTLLYASIGTDTNTECSLSSDVKAATFKLGYIINKTDENVIKNNYTYDAKDGGVLGVAIFTNGKVDNWQIVKKSSSEGETSLWLPDAEFTLTASNLKSADDKPLVYNGKSNVNGIIEWKLVDKPVASADFEPDTYILEETKAPTGYMVSGDKWTITINCKGGKPIIKCGDAVISSDSTIAAGIYTYVYENTPIYQLPSTGGKGIYWYSIGGMLLMMAAALILYKNKSRGVLKS